MPFPRRTPTSRTPSTDTTPVVHRSTYRAPLASPAPDSGESEPAGTTVGTTAGTTVDRAVERGAQHARHRAEPVGNRRAGARGIRRLAALSGASAILGITAFGAVSGLSGGLATASPAGGDTAAHAGTNAGEAANDTLTVAAPTAAPVVRSGLSVASAPFTGGTQVTVQGEELDGVAAVTVGTTPATIVAADETQLTFQVPAVADTTLGDVAVSLTDVLGRPVATELPTTTSLASLTSTDPAGILAPTTTIEVPNHLTLTYTSDPRIDAQLGYVLSYWNSYNTAQYTVLGGVDCANFTSQSLVARGWAMDADWYYDAATGTSSPSWMSSTAMRDWLLARPDLATPLDDSQRGLVKVGDIAQFDWDGSGDRDHTAVVTRVEHTAAGTRVWVGGHTKDADYWDVDEALATGGGSVTYFSLA